MKIAVVGSGGREHALAWKFAQLQTWENVFTLPGNGGIPNSHSIDVRNFAEVESFCNKNGIKLIFVGPEQPLTEGIVDFFQNTDIQIFGPDKAAARLEGSKIFAKKFMAKHGVVTADFKAFGSKTDAKSFIEEKNGDCVIKFDGLAAGKGVFVCSSVEEAEDVLQELNKQYGENAEFIIEDKIPGDEISIMTFTDGKTIKLLQTSQDHKQLLEGDKGPNTGGMGAYSPVPNVRSELLDKIQEKIIAPTLAGIQAEHMNYKGIIYFGIMVKDNEPYLLEYNIRFGDPETEVLLPALKTDLTEITLACINQNLADIEFEFEDGYFADVVLVSGGYPKAYKKGLEISGLGNLSSDTLVFHAGTKKDGNKLVTSGGRVLNIVCKASTPEKSLEKVYSEIEKIHFDDMFFRKDIGKRENSYLR